MNKLVLATRKYKVGYEVRDELHRTDFEAVVMDYGDGQNAKELDALVDYIRQPSDVIVKSAYTPNGDYIGNKKMAHFLITKRGISPEKMTPSHKVCSIGFCEKEKKWYGWSHRAIFGFGIGDTVKEGDCTNSSGWTDEYLKDRPEDDRSLPVGFTALTLRDTKSMAIAFAESVG